MEYFDGIKDGLGTNLRVALSRAYLESIGKHNAPIWHAQGMKDEDVVHQVAEECIQTDTIAKKLLRWAKHPIIGSMYSPGYLIGTDVIRRASSGVGSSEEERMRINRLGLHLEGLVDINVFEEKSKLR